MSKRGDGLQVIENDALLVLVLGRQPDHTVTMTTHAVKMAMHRLGFTTATTSKTLSMLRRAGTRVAQVQPGHWRLTSFGQEYHLHVRLVLDRLNW